MTAVVGLKPPVNYCVNRLVKYLSFQHQRLEYVKEYDCWCIRGRGLRDLRGPKPDPKIDSIIDKFANTKGRFPLPEFTGRVHGPS